jgi:nitroimidazol reductase NimA-like FMN-containing flavoprotein (pyridoxamine 5'-phosphate oxidase superfamily)
MDLSMSVEDRETFLAQLHVGIIGLDDLRDGAGTAPGNRAPLLVPVWYAYRPGGTVDVQTGRESLKARLIREAGRFSLCAQDETAPYRYVSVEGPLVSVQDPVPPEAREALAHRYLPPGEAEPYLAGTRGQLTDDVVLRMRPQRWRTADFAAFAAEFDSDHRPEAQPLLQSETQGSS